MKPNHLTSCTAATLLVMTSAVTFANSARLPEAGKFFITPAIGFQSFDEFYAGSTKVATPPGGEDIERSSFRLYLDHAFTDQWAVDASIGFFDVQSGEGGPFTEGDQSGLADTNIGIRRALLTQAEQEVDLALRLGSTIPGDYETGQLSAPGDDAFGADLKLLAGRSFGGTRIEGGVGYALNEGAVPEMFLFDIKVIQEIANGFSVDVGYRYFDADGNLDIGGPGFTPARLPEVSEKGNIIELGLAYGDAGGRYYRIYGSLLVDGENVGREESFGASVTFSF
ncbi:MAG: hypothetical protein ACRCXD_12965 [Luteolibacter sp.]